MVGVPHGEPGVSGRRRPVLFLWFGLPLLLALLSYAVLRSDDLQTIDRSINAFFGPYRRSGMLAVFLWITALGATPAIAAVCLTATLLLWSQRLLRPVGGLWVTYVGAEVTTWVLKYLVGRVRPEFLEVATAHSPSFPSGHSTSAMAIYGFLGAFLADRLPGGRATAPLCAALLILAVGFSRIFLSLHYASDVFGGYLVGTFWLVAGTAVTRRQT